MREVTYRNENEPLYKISPIVYGLVYMSAHLDQWGLGGGRGRSKPSYPPHNPYGESNLMKNTRKARAGSPQRLHFACATAHSEEPRGRPDRANYRNRE